MESFSAAISVVLIVLILPLSLAAIFLSRSSRLWHNLQKNQEAYSYTVDSLADTDGEGGVNPSIQVSYSLSIRSPMKKSMF